MWHTRKPRFHIPTIRKVFCIIYFTRTSLPPSHPLHFPPPVYHVSRSAHILGNARFSIIAKTGGTQCTVWNIIVFQPSLFRHVICLLFFLNICSTLKSQNIFPVCFFFLFITVEALCNPCLNINILGDFRKLTHLIMESKIY